MKMKSKRSLVMIRTAAHQKGNGKAEPPPKLYTYESPEFTEAGL